MANPLVSIGVTAFNAENTIVSAIQSALSQYWSPIEIIVVDDCSSDATVSLAREMVATNTAVRLIRHDVNAGVAAARNTILAEAKGEFVAFFDDDDQSVPHRITTQVERIRAYERTLPPEALVICHAARRQLYPNGLSRVEATMGTQTEGPVPSGPAVALRVLTGRPLRNGYGSCATCSQMARLTTYRSVGGFDPAFRRSEDTDLCIRLALEGAHFVGIAQPLVTQQMMVTSDKSLNDELAFASAVLRKHSAQFVSAADYDFAQDWLTLKYQWLRGHRTAFRLGLAKLALRRPVSVLKRIIFAFPLAATRVSKRLLYATAD